MRFYFSIVVALVGSAAAFDGTLPLFADNLESFRNKFEAAYASNSSSDITVESTMTRIARCVKTEESLRDAVRKARTKGPRYTSH